MIINDWLDATSKEIAAQWSFGGGRDSYVTDEQRAVIAANIKAIILKHCPFKLDMAYEEIKTNEERP